MSRVRGCQWLGEEMTGLSPSARSEPAQPGFGVTHVIIGPKINGPCERRRQEFHFAFPPFAPPFPPYLQSSISYLFITIFNIYDFFFLDFELIFPLRVCLRIKK